MNTPLEQDSILNRVESLEKKFEEISSSVSQNNIVLNEVLKTLKTIVNKSEKVQERSEDQSPTTPSPTEYHNFWFHSANAYKNSQRGNRNKTLDYGGGSCGCVHPGQNENVQET